MSTAMPMLAASGDDPTVKLIIGVAIAAFWIIAQVIGSLTKKPDKTLPPSRNRPQPTTNLPPVLQRPVPTPRSTVPPAKRPPPMRPQRTGPPLRAPDVRRLPAKPLAAAPPMPRPAPATRAALTQSAPAVQPMQQRELLGALLRPRNLRKAFVLTELIQPPVALREPRE